MVLTIGSGSSGGGEEAKVQKEKRKVFSYFLFHPKLNGNSRKKTAAVGFGKTIKNNKKQETGSAAKPSPGIFCLKLR